MNAPNDSQEDAHSTEKIFCPTRSQEDLFNLLVSDTSLPLYKKVAIGIEEYISKLPVEEQPSAWQSFPYLLQFLPIFIKYHVKLSDIGHSNPGLEYGGITEYDKHIIHDKIPSQYFPKTLNIFQEIPPSYDEIIDLLDLHKFDKFPLMHKPNKGERGAQMYYLPTLDAFQRHWKKLMNGEIERQPSSIQQYCDWPEEYCLQFYQHTDEKDYTNIEVGSLGFRDTPYVYGDGCSTVEELIQAHSQLSETHKVNIIQKISETQQELLNTIPSDQEKVQIVFTASIEYGTKYRTIAQSPDTTAQLENVIRNLLINLPPSFISVGRFDLKARSLEELLAGEVIVIECNAAGGIPTHVYDESLTIPQKYEELYTHFDKVYQIIQRNKIPIIGRIGTILARPGFIRISYSSVAKKGINFFDKSNEKAKNVRRIYKDIFNTLRMGRRERRKRRIESLGMLGRRFVPFN